MVSFRSLGTSITTGLLCDICRQGKPKDQELLDMKIAFADGETVEGSIAAVVHYGCLVKKAQEERERNARRISKI